MPFNSNICNWTAIENLCTPMHDVAFRTQIPNGLQMIQRGEFWSLHINPTKHFMVNIVPVGDVAGIEVPSRKVSFCSKSPNELPHEYDSSKMVVKTNQKFDSSNLTM